MSHLQSRHAGSGASAWVVHWIEGMLLFAGGAFIAYVVGLADITVNKIWQVSAIAAAALSLGFGAAYLFQQLRQNAESVAMNAEFVRVSARIDALVADYHQLEHKVRSEESRRSETGG